MRRDGDRDGSWVKRGGVTPNGDCLKIDPSTIPAVCRMKGFAYWEGSGNLNLTLDYSRANPRRRWGEWGLFHYCGTRELANLKHRGGSAKQEFLLKEIIKKKKNFLLLVGVSEG